jgi:ADP-ribose pyrophosphatase YjhB (NUDIX family)
MKCAAFAVILNKDNQVLLCHRRDVDLWNLPGGGCNDGEPP